MSYETPSCAYCPPNIRACRHGESDTCGPGFCPSKVDGDGIDAAAGAYEDDLARTLSAVLESHGFEVASVACKNGGVPKESLGVRDDEKINPVGALQLAETYYARIWGPARPATLPSKPAEGRA